MKPSQPEASPRRSLACTVKLADLPSYEKHVRELVAPGADVTLTGPAPVWLYLRLAHSLDGRAKVLTCESPITGPVEIFNHNPH